MDNNTNTPTTGGGQNFASVLSQLRRGQTMADLSEAVTTLVARVRETRKKGSVTLKISVAPQSKGDDVILILTDDVKTTLPVAERGASIFFANDDNTLVRNDPRQGELKLTVVANIPERARQTG